MGKEARLRAAQRADQEEALKKVDLPRLALAIRKLCSAASDKFGSDCGLHAQLALAVLARLGVECTLRAGVASWRVGNGDGDVVSHVPLKGMPPQQGLAYHIWLEVGDTLLDFTTYQLRLKAERLDGLDGGHTTVDWCPDFLCVARSSVSSYGDVARFHVGLFHYEAVDSLLGVVLDADGPDPADVELAWTLYQCPDIRVMGPNSVGKEDSRCR